MNTKELFELRKLINAAIVKQLHEEDHVLARAISNVITGIAFDIGRIADAIERSCQDG